MTSTRNPYQALHADVLHQSDLGIFKMLVGILRDMGHQILGVLDEHLGRIREESRFPSFQLPGNKFEGYFSSPEIYAGFRAQRFVTGSMIEPYLLYIKSSLRDFEACFGHCLCLQLIDYVDVKSTRSS